MLKYCLIKTFSIMEQVFSESKISVKEAEEHYQSSKENYTIESAESHLAYYREKYPKYFAVLSQNV
tara:strand:+ start:2026 stop:2223 length:198 start_codon:yes stop_codon:yes gene_type:complete